MDCGRSDFNGSKQCDIARKKTTLQHIKKRPQHDVL